MNTFPSHKNSINARNERRQNWKAEMKGETVRAELNNRMIETFRKNAVKTVKAGLVSNSGNRFFIKAGKRHYAVYKIQDSFVCDCNDRAKYGDCTHQHSARIFAEGAVNA